MKAVLIKTEKGLRGATPADQEAWGKFRRRLETMKPGTWLRVESSSPRNGNHHPTVKPTDLMRYLCRLVTPPGGVVLDPFMGSGSTGKAAVLEGLQFVGIEREAEYLAIARDRISYAEALCVSGAERLEPATARDPHTFDLFGEAA